MSDGAAQSQDLSHFPPGTVAPTRNDNLTKGRNGWNSLPKEERARRRAEKAALREERQQKKLAKLAEKEAKRALKLGGRVASHTEPSPPPDDDTPPTERSHRAPAAEAAPERARERVPNSEAPRALTGSLKGLLDLVAAMPHLGDGSCFIQVNRVKPQVSHGVTISGVQRPITAPMDDHEFALAYGGHQYQLRGYKYLDDGRLRSVTDPVPYMVPGPPNLDSLPTPEEDDPMPHPNRSMAPGQPPFRRNGVIVPPHVATADAAIHERNLEHEETMDERNERRRKEREAADREERRAGKNLELERERLAFEAKEREAQRREEAHQRELDLARGNGVGDFAELLKVMRPGEENAALLRQHSQEIRQLSESHKEEIVRLQEASRHEVQRLTEMHQQAIIRLEDQLRAAGERADRMIRESDQRSNEHIREVERKADQRVQDAINNARTVQDDLRTRGEERLRDQNQTWQQRFDDMRLNHDRDMKRKDDEIALMRQGMEGNHAIILSTKDETIKRLEREVRDAKKEAEDNKDWVGKIEKFEKQAEALGFSKDEGKGEEGEGEDLKTTALKMGLQTLTRLPELVQASASAIQQIRNPGVPPEMARNQARPGPRSMRTIPRTHQPAPQFTFGTEGGAAYVPPPGALPPMMASPYGSPHSPPPPQPDHAPEMQAPPMDFNAPQGAIVPVDAAGEFVTTPAQQIAPPGAPTSPPQSMTPAPQPQQAQAAPQPSVPPPASAAAPAGMSEQAAAVAGILSAQLAQDFENQATAASVVDKIFAENPVELVRMALQEVSFDQLVGYVRSRVSDFPRLASREGVKFLREVWTLAEEKATAP